MIEPHKIKRIYSSLQDDVSREIFVNRLLYSLTADFEITRNQNKPVNRIMQRVMREVTPIVIYGAGKLGEHFLKSFPNIKVFGVCDSDPAKIGTNFHEHIITAPNELYEKFNFCKVVVTVLDTEIVGRIILELKSMGFADNKVIMYNNIEHDSFFINDCYFPLDIEIPFLEKEVFIDGGSYDFQNSISFINMRGKTTDKIIFIEPQPDQYKICEQKAKKYSNVIGYNCGLWNESKMLNLRVPFVNAMSASFVRNRTATSFSVAAMKLDDLLNGEVATFIKLDVEGAELNALIGAERTIKKHKPKLAVCIYHKPSDVWEIPDYILSLHEDYRLYLRHHHICDYDDTVLYAF